MNYRRSLRAAARLCPLLIALVPARAGAVKALLSRHEQSQVHVWDSADPNVTVLLHATKCNDADYNLGEGSTHGWIAEHDADYFARFVVGNAVGLDAQYTLGQGGRTHYDYPKHVTVYEGEIIVMSRNDGTLWRYMTTGTEIGSVETGQTIGQGMATDGADLYVSLWNGQASEFARYDAAFAVKQTYANPSGLVGFNNIVDLVHDPVTGRFFGIVISGESGTISGSTTVVEFEMGGAVIATYPLPFAVDGIGALNLSVCGNGKTEVGEECDDGNATDDDACTNQCKFNVCGDAIVQVRRANTAFVTAPSSAAPREAPDQQLELLGRLAVHLRGPREDRALERLAAAAAARELRGGRDRGAEQLDRVGDVGVHRLDHLLVGDLGALLPAVVVRDEGGHRVAHLGLARELGLRDGRHADHRGAERAVEVGLGLRRELGALHADVGAALARRQAELAALRAEQPRLLGAERAVEGDVGDDAVAEERRGPALRPVEDLVGDDEVQRRQLLAQRADGADRQQPLDAERLERPDVGAHVDLGGQQDVAAAVAREEGALHSAELADRHGPGGLAERRLDLDRAHAAQPGDLVESGAAEDSDLDCLFHSSRSAQGM
jgi:cysteine-rich repeat protein